MIAFKGSEVAQLYLSFPATAGEPPRQLKAFQKVCRSLCSMVLCVVCCVCVRVRAHACILAGGGTAIAVCVTGCGNTGAMPEWCCHPPCRAKALH